MKNSYRIEENKVYIYLKNVGKEAVVSIEDFDRVNAMNGTYYAHCHINTKLTYIAINTKTPDGLTKYCVLHRIVMDATDGKMQVDHINHNTLDNTRDNLRLVTQQENLQNKSKYKNNQTGYKGVDILNGRWRARIQNKYKTIHLGLFDNPIDAHNAYCKAKLRLHEGTTIYSLNGGN